MRTSVDVNSTQVNFLDRLERVRRGGNFRWRRTAMGVKVPHFDEVGSGATEADPAAQPTPDARHDSVHAAAPAKGSYEAAAECFESYQFDEPESKLHFEERVDNRSSATRHAGWSVGVG